MLSEHVMRKHAALTAEAVGRSQAPMPMSTPGGGEGASGASTLLHPNGRRPLAERLREGVTMCTDPVPVPLLRKYIAYARCVRRNGEKWGQGAACRLTPPPSFTVPRRRYVHPALSPDAARVFQAFYLDLRATASEGDSVPITTRQLESLVRLGQARARLELREIVTKEDAEDVVELLRESMTDVATDDFGVVDFGRGAGMSMAKQVKAFVKVLARAAEERNSSTFTTQVSGSGVQCHPQRLTLLCAQDMRQLAAGLGLDLTEFDSFLDVLNQQNYILKRGPRLYKLMAGGA